jgi:hypothetical protein
MNELVVPTAFAAALREPARTGTFDVGVFADIFAC